MGSLRCEQRVERRQEKRKQEGQRKPEKTKVYKTLQQNIGREN
jgi:hypothetical protein